MQISPDQFFIKSIARRANWILLLLVLAVFLPAIKNDFTAYDDPEYVTANVHVQNGLTWDGIKWAFSAHGANWHPLIWLVHLLNGQLFGLKPWAHHLTNVLLHSLNTLLVFLWLKMMTDKRGRSFIAALLFGLHPLRVESVAWVAELKDVLSMFFWLLTLMAYAEYAYKMKTSPQNNPRRFYFLSLFLFGLGLLSKSMVVTLPFVLLLLDFWPLERWRNKKIIFLVLEKIPFLFLAIIMSVIAYFAQQRGTAMVSSLSLKARIANALISYCRYLGKLFWPENLSPIYPYPDHWPLGWVCGAGLFLMSVSLVFLWLHRPYPWLVLGWFWYLGTLVPVIGLVQIGEQAMADRYSYIPSIGIFILLVWSISEIIRHWRYRMAIAATATALVAMVLIVLTEKQIRYWKNTEAMFQRAVDVTENNTLASVGLGDCLAERGELDAAIAQYRAALRVSPNYYEAHNNLGLAWLKKGELDEAILQFQSARQARPGSPESYANLGTALARQGANPAAIVQFERSLERDAANPLTHSNLGKLFLAESRFEEAEKQFNLAISLEPTNALFHYSRATALGGLKNFGAATAEFQTALSFAPHNADIHNDLGTILALQGQLDPAIAEFKEALKLNPNQVHAKENLAKALKLKTSKGSK